MADQQLENELPDMPAAERNRTGSDSTQNFKPLVLLRKNLKLLLLLSGASGMLALATAYWVFSDAHPSQQVVPIAREGSLTTRHKAIKVRRSLMRTLYRSSHSQYLVKEEGSKDMVWLTAQAELSLLTGLFNHYVETTAQFFELFRIMSNNYLNQRWEILELFDRQLLPRFETAERRRTLLRRRIEHEPAVELFKKINYIAYHDSIAVVSFQRYLTSGSESEFTLAVDFANEAKLLIKEFWNYFQVHLQNYQIDFEPSPDFWNRYYGPWPVEKP